MNNLAKLWLLLALLMSVSFGHAIEMLDYLTDADGKYAGPSVEDNIAKMDTDHNGFADVAEVRAFLELKHGAGYQKSLLDRWEVAANTTSCGTSFAKELIE
ncbi:MAG: hypothetical protein OR997_01505 [Methylophilaceae bacterium]|jgi:hypothetical protein|nr:hypothetical protein [Methylophilaceae bacterium]